MAKKFFKTTCDDHVIQKSLKRGLGKSFLVDVPDHRAETLKKTIVLYAQDGSHNISVCWAAYAGIYEINHGIQCGDIVIHQHRFMDPGDDTIDIYGKSLELHQA